MQRTCTVGSRVGAMVLPGTSPGAPAAVEMESPPPLKKAFSWFWPPPPPLPPRLGLAVAEEVLEVRAGRVKGSMVVKANEGWTGGK